MNSVSNESVIAIYIYIIVMYIVMYIIILLYIYVVLDREMLKSQQRFLYYVSYWERTITNQFQCPLNLSVDKKPEE